MIATTSEPKPIFNLSDLAKARMELLEKKYGILPDEVQPEGYYYDGETLLKAIQLEHSKDK